MKTYHVNDEIGDGPGWVCGHWNGSPVEIGMGPRIELGSYEVMHHHPYCEYYVVLEGEAELEVEGEQVPLRAGMVVMIEPDERHMVTSVGDGGAHWIVIKERSVPGSKHVP